MFKLDPPPPPAHKSDPAAVGWLQPLGLVETEVYSEVMLLKTFQEQRFV